MKTRQLHARRPAPAGFSLAELLVVLVIIGLLATVVVRNVWPAIFQANEKKVIADITVIESALDEYAMSHGGQFPDSLEPLILPDENGQTLLKGKTIPKDPWGAEYMYDPPDRGEPTPRIYTYGADGQAGGEGQDKDIDNHMIRDGQV